MKINYWHKFEIGKFYHLYNRGIDKQRLFYEDKNYQYFLDKWKQYLHPYLNVYAYCLIPNHFHFLVSVLDSDTILNNYKNIKNINAYIDDPNQFLENQFRFFFSAYSKAINKQENRTGSLFQQRFKRILIKDDFDLITKLCYIHHNPIHHYISNNYNEWMYSSYLAYQSKKSTLVKKDFILELINGIEAFYTLHNEFKFQSLDSFEKD